jgi:transcriptional regulator with XRE-family HTH domain
VPGSGLVWAIAENDTTYVVVVRFYKSYESRSNMKEIGHREQPRDVWAKRFKQARLASGLSQKDVGIAAGLDEFVASTRINRYEVGVHQPDYQMAGRLSRVLDIPVAFLYCDNDEMASMLLSFHRAPKAVRRAAMKMLHPDSDV